MKASSQHQRVTYCLMIKRENINGSINVFEDVNDCDIETNTIGIS